SVSHASASKAISASSTPRLTWANDTIDPAVTRYAAIAVVARHAVAKRRPRGWNARARRNAPSTAVGTARSASRELRYRLPRSHSGAATAATTATVRALAHTRGTALARRRVNPSAASAAYGIPTNT